MPLLYSRSKWLTVSILKMLRDLCLFHHTYQQNNHQQSAVVQLAITNTFYRDIGLSQAFRKLCIIIFSFCDQITLKQVLHADMLFSKAIY